MKRISALLIIPVFFAFAAIDSAYQPSYSATGYKPFDDDKKKAFTEVFSKYLESSFYSNNFRDAFSILRAPAAIKDKHNPDSQYEVTLPFPDKSFAIINYIQVDQVANVHFSSKHKEASDAKMDFDTNQEWVREVLGPYYEVREINHESTPSPAHFLYFYRPGVDTANQYAFHVEVDYLYNGFTKKYESEITINAQKKN